MHSFFTFLHNKFVVVQPRIIAPVLIPGECIASAALRAYLVADGREAPPLPAEGALFLTNYRLVYRGAPADPFGEYHSTNLLHSASARSRMVTRLTLTTIQWPKRFFKQKSSCERLKFVLISFCFYCRKIFTAKIPFVSVSIPKRRCIVSISAEVDYNQDHKTAAANDFCFQIFSNCNSCNNDTVMLRCYMNAIYCS